MEPRRKDPKSGQSIASILLVSLMLISLVPAVANPVAADDSGRDANISLSISPSSQTVNPGETAEYTVRVYNNGANPVSVNLAATNAQDCNGYSATIGQIGQPIEANDYGETFLNVTLAQTEKTHASQRLLPMLTSRQLRLTNQVSQPNNRKMWKHLLVMVLVQHCLELI